MADSKQKLPAPETSAGDNGATLQPTDNQQPTTMESKLGVTTVRVRSKRYAFPSVIVKTDADKEGVCVMLDVGLFCPFCAKSYKSKFSHKRSRVSLGRQGNSDSGSTDPDKTLMDTDNSGSATGSSQQPLQHTSRLAKPDLSALEKFSEFRSDKERSQTNERVISQSNNGLDTYMDSSSGQQTISEHVHSDSVQLQQEFEPGVRSIHDDLRGKSFTDMDKTMDTADINANTFSHGHASPSVELHTTSTKVTQLQSFRGSVENAVTEKEQNKHGYSNGDQTSPKREPQSADNRHRALTESANMAKVDLSRSYERTQKQGTLYQTTNTDRVNIYEPGNKDIECLKIREQSDNLGPRDQTQMGSNSNANTVVERSVHSEYVQRSNVNEVAKTGIETNTGSVIQDANINKLCDINTDNTETVLSVNTCTEQTSVTHQDPQDNTISLNGITNNDPTTTVSNSDNAAIDSSFEVSSGDDSYKDVDEDTLREIEQKLIENLAKMEEEERMYELQNSANTAFEQAQLGDKPESSSIYEHVKVSTSVSKDAATVSNPETRTRIPSVKDIYEQAMSILDDKALPEQLPAAAPNDVYQSPRNRQRSESPELIMEQILDELKAETEMYSGDATLPRVFSVRREKRQRLLSNDDTDNDVTSVRKETSGSYVYEKNEKNGAEKPLKYNVEQFDESMNTRIVSNGVAIDVVDGTESIDDTLEDEYLKTHDTHDSTTSDRVNSATKSLDVTQISMGADSVFAQSLSRSAHKFAALHGLKPKEADEIFETAFEDALDSMENDTNDWTSDYETDVVQTVMQNSQFINENTGNYREYIEQLNAQELLVRRASSRGSSTEHLPESRAHSVVSSEGSYALHTSRDSRSSSRDKEGVTVDSCISELIEDTQQMTDDINQEPNNSELLSKKLKPLFCETMNIERSHIEEKVKDTVLFHTPTDVCAPLSPTIYPANVALAKTKTLTLLSSQDDLDNTHEFDDPDEKTERGHSDANDESFSDVFVTQEDIYNPLLNMFAKERYLIRSGSGSSPPIFERKSSMDELSESSTLSSVDEFIPEIEQPNAPPEVMQKAYEAAIEVAKMFHQHYMIHPCFHKIMEENGSGKSEDVSNYDKDHVTTPMETNDAEFKHDDSLNKDQTKQFLTHMFGTGHSEHKQKRSDLHSCMKDICATCSDKPDDGEIVTSEEVTTQEVTLVFAWPKGKKGRAIKEGKTPFREMNLRRILRSGNVDVEVIEGPSLKTIEQSVGEASSENGKFHSTAVENSTTTSQPICTGVTDDKTLVSKNEMGASGSNDTTESQSNAVSEKALVTKQDPNSEFDKISIPRGIIADIDVRVTTTRFEPFHDKVIATRKTDDEVKSVNKITSDILHTLSKTDVITQIDPHVSNNEQRSLPSNHVLSIGYLPEDENKSDRPQSTADVYTADTVANTEYTHHSDSDNNKQPSEKYLTKTSIFEDQSGGQTDKNADATNKTVASPPLDVTHTGVVFDSSQVKEVKTPQNLEVKAEEEEQKLPPQKLPEKLARKQLSSSVRDAYIKDEGNKNLNDPISNQNTHKQLDNKGEIIQGNHEQKDKVTEISAINTYADNLIHTPITHTDGQTIDESARLLVHKDTISYKIKQSEIQNEISHFESTQTRVSNTELSQTELSKSDVTKADLQQVELPRSAISQSITESQVTTSDASTTELSITDKFQLQFLKTELSPTELTHSVPSQSGLLHTEPPPPLLSQKKHLRTETPRSEPEVSRTEIRQPDISESLLPETDHTGSSMDFEFHDVSDPMSQWAMDILETETVLTGGRPSGETITPVDRPKPNPFSPKQPAPISHLCTPHHDSPSSDNDNQTTPGDFPFHNAPTMHLDTTPFDSPTRNQHTAPMQARKRLSDTDLSVKLKEINDDLDKMFPSNKMYSSLQDLGVKGQKARSKRLSLSETLLLNVETQVRRATSEDEISDLIENCATMMEMSIRSSLDSKLTDSDMSTTDINVHGSSESTKAKSQKRAAAALSGTLDTIHEGLANQKQPFHRHVADGVPVADRQVEEPKTPPATKPKPVLKPTIASPSKDTSMKSPPPTKPKPKIDMGQFVKQTSKEDSSVQIQPLSPTVHKSITLTKQGSQTGSGDKPVVPRKPPKIQMCNVTRSSVPSVKTTDKDPNQMSPEHTTTKSEKPLLSPKSKYIQSSKVPPLQQSVVGIEAVAQDKTRLGKGSVNTILDFNYSQAKQNEQVPTTTISVKDTTNKEESSKEHQQEDTDEKEEDIIALMNSLERKYSTGSVETEQLQQPWTPKSNAMRRLLQQQNVTGFSYDLDQPQREETHDECEPLSSYESTLPTEGSILQTRNAAELGHEVGISKTRQIDAKIYFEPRHEVSDNANQVNSAGQNKEDIDQPIATSSLLRASRNIYQRDHDATERISSLPEPMNKSEILDMRKNTSIPDINGNSRLMSAEDIHLMEKEECTPKLNKKIKLTGMSSSAPKIDSNEEFKSALWEKTQSDPAFDKTNKEILQQQDMSHVDTSSTIVPRSMDSSELFYSSEATLVGGDGEESCSQEFVYVSNTQEEVQLERASTPKVDYIVDNKDTSVVPSERSDSMSTLDELVQINYEAISSDEIELKRDLTPQDDDGRPHRPSHSSNNTELGVNTKEYLETLCDSVVSQSIGLASEVLHNTDPHSPEPLQANTVSPNIASSEIYKIQDKLTTTTTTSTRIKQSLSSLDDSGHYDSRLDSTLDSDNVSSAGSSPFDEETLAYYKHKGMRPPFNKQMSSDSEAYTTDSEVDVTEYKTFVTDDLIRTDLDGVEVAQFNRTPSLADSSECYSQYGITPQTDTASEADTDDLFIQIPGTTFLSSSDNANTIKLLKEETDKLTQELLASLNEDSRQRAPVKPAIDKVYTKKDSTSSIPDSAIQPEPVKPVTDRAFVALDTRNVPNVLPIHHANTWSDVTNVLKPISLLGSPAKSPSFSPTSTSAFSVRDDDYAKQSRLLLKKQAHDSSSSVENDQSSPKVSLSDSSNIQSKPAHFQMASANKEEPNDKTDQGLSTGASKQGWQLRRSSSLDMPKVHSVSSQYKDCGKIKNPVADPNASTPSTRILHTGVSMDSAYPVSLQAKHVVIDSDEKTTKALPPSILVRRHSTGSINSNVVVMDTRLKSKPPVVPRKPPRASKYKETSL